MAWRAAEAIKTLRHQIDKAAPGRSIVNDGIVGDAAHQSRTSDHNPWVNGPPGVVTAIDITHDPKHGVDSYALAEYFRTHPDKRIKYIISNRRIAGNAAYASRNKTKPWTWDRYSLKNPHDCHMHISVESRPGLYDDASDWDLSGFSFKPDTSAPKTEERPILRRGAKGADVKRLQQLLGKDQDGVFGPLTENAVRDFQSTHGIGVDGIVGSYTWRELEKSPATETPKGLITNVVATVFGRITDNERSAYDDHLIKDDELGVSLPARIKGKLRNVEVTNRANGKKVVGAVIDVGPWYTTDDYWVRKERPLVERYKIVQSGVNKGRRHNGAAIDLTPAMAVAIGINGMGHVDWRFV